MPEVLEHDVSAPTMVLEMDPVQWTDKEFFRFCVRNKGWRIERAADGNIIIMEPVGGTGSSGNAMLTHLFVTWALKDGTGTVFDATAGFKLPNGAIRSPDVSWVKNSRLRKIQRDERDEFLPLCPDFALEFRSPSDRMTKLTAKMSEYMANGVRLGWLLDSIRKEAVIYRPNAEPEKLRNPRQLFGEGVLKGFVLEVEQVWAAMNW
jgi:Uma2 family endonuclease